MISIGNSTVSRGIWDKYREWYFKIHQNITSRRCGEWYLGSFEISLAGIYPKYPEETVLFPVYTTRQRNFAFYVTGVIFTCKYFIFGFNTTGFSQSHFGNLSACSIIDKIGRHEVPLPIDNKYYTFRVSWKGQTAGDKFGKFSILCFCLKFRFLRHSCRRYGNYIEVCDWFI